MADITPPATYEPLPELNRMIDWFMRNAKGRHPKQGQEHLNGRVAQIEVLKIIGRKPNDNGRYPAVRLVHADYVMMLFNAWFQELLIEMLNDKDLARREQCLRNGGHHWQWSFTSEDVGFYNCACGASMTQNLY